MPDKERFWSKVNKAGDNDCWNWIARWKTTGGYGMIRWGPSHKKSMAHRVAYELSVGPIPDGHVVMHLCDNPSCCNPAHLSTGTQAENLADMTEKGRRRWGCKRGTEHHNAKLTPSKVIKIRSFDGTDEEAARMFRVSKTCIRRVKSGQAWSHVTGG